MPLSATLRCHTPHLGTNLCLLSFPLVHANTIYNHKLIAPHPSQIQFRSVGNVAREPYTYGSEKRDRGRLDISSPSSTSTHSKVCICPFRRYRTALRSLFSAVVKIRAYSRLRVVWIASDGSETVLADTTEGYRVLETTWVGWSRLKMVLLGMRTGLTSCALDIHRLTIFPRQL